MQNKDKIRQSMTQKIRKLIFLRKTPFKKISAVAVRLVHLVHQAHLFLVACGFP